MKSKKADMTMVFLISTIILILSLVVIVSVWDKFFSKAEESTAESLCMGFNALRVRTKVDKAGISFNTIPLTCKTLDKVIPSDIYPQTKEGAMEEMRGLVAKCWWMFLEGAAQNAFAKDKLWPWGNAPCFTCYRFKIKKDIKGLNEVSWTEFDQSLIETTYLADITSGFDDCAPIGGGVCITDKPDGTKCSSNHVKYKDLKTAVSSNKCDKDEHCCISGKFDECENKGGKCIDLDSRDSCKTKGGDYKNQYDKWNCRTGACCIRDENYYSYLKYVQSFRGDGVILAALKEQKFVPEREQYAVTFVSPHVECGWGCKALLGVTTVVTGGVIVGLSIATGGIAIPILIGGAVGAGGAAAILAKMTAIKDLNAILISELDTVQTQCAVQPDTTGP